MIGEVNIDIFYYTWVLELEFVLFSFVILFVSDW